MQRVTQFFLDKPITYGQWEPQNCASNESTTRLAELPLHPNDTVEVVVLTDVGRELFFTVFWAEKMSFTRFPRTQARHAPKNVSPMAAKRLWVSPEVERTYYPDNIACLIQETTGGVRVTAPVEDRPPGTHLQKEIEVRLDSSGSRVRVLHRISNHDRQTTQLAPWAISMMAPGGRAILPLPPKAPLDMQHLLPVGLFALWSYTDFADPRWRLGTKYIQLRQEAHPTGRFGNRWGHLQCCRMGRILSRRTSLHEAGFGSRGRPLSRPRDATLRCIPIQNSLNWKRSAH